MTVPETRGKLPIGTPPAVTMQAESVDGWCGRRSGYCGHRIPHAVRGRGQVQLQFPLAVMAGSNPDLAWPLRSHTGRPYARSFWAQVINGDGADNNLSGVLRATDIQSATYTEAQRGEDSFYLGAEAAVEDADGMPETMAWLLGTT